MKKIHEISINDYFDSDPLCEENLARTLNLVYELRSLFPQSIIFLSSEYMWGHIMDRIYVDDDFDYIEASYKEENMALRENIIRKCDIYTEYFEESRTNEIKIDVKESIKQGEIVQWIV